MIRRLQKSLLRSLPATALVLASALSAGPALAGGPAHAGTAAVAAVAPAAVDESTTPVVSLDIDTASTAVDGDDSLELTITVDNTTLSDLPNGSVVVSAGTATIGSRATLHAHVDGTDPLPTAAQLVEVPIPSVVAGSTYTTSTVVIPHDRLAMPADYGAVPLSAAFSAGSTSVAAHSTYVAAAAAPASTIGLTLAMPITAPTGQGGLIGAESLATYTAPGGILTRQLDGAAGRDVALGVDPMIVASIRALGAAAPASATAWLDRLAAVPNDTFALQFADADGAVQAAAGLDALLTPGSLDFGVPDDYAAVPPTGTPTPDPSATTPAEGDDAGDAAGDGDGDAEEDPAAARPTTEDLLAFDWTSDGMLWPAEGTVAETDLATFGASGVTDTVVSSSSSTDTGTHPAAATVGDANVLVADDAISAALRDAATAVTASAFSDAVARLSAELAVSARESGATESTLLATLDRGWPPTAQRLGEALDALDALPTADPVDLPALRAEERTDVTLDAVEPDASRASAAALLVDRERQLTDFSSLLTTPQLLTGRERAEILGLLAVNWRSTPDEWTDALMEHNEQTTDLLGSVSILNPSDVLLVGNESAIPFGVRNDSPYDVAVEIAAFPSNIRLDVGAPQTIEVAAGSRQTVRVPVKAQLGNGDVSLTVTLASLTGMQVGQPVTATVAVRADWEGIGAVIAVLLVVAMLIAGIVRTVLRRRARRAERAGSIGASAPSSSTEERS